ncbi:MAG: transcriptional regulator [Verrucomicrobiales bacterium]|nr:transcriptional regulator [Verrucomicrobiales bacterium]
MMAALAATPELSFTELRDLLQMTDGNLTTHIRTLQEAGFVAITKEYRDNRPLTTCSLTTAGRAAFQRHIERLAEIVAQARHS